MAHRVQQALVAHKQVSLEFLKDKHLKAQRKIDDIARQLIKNDDVVIGLQ